MKTESINGIFLQKPDSFRIMTQEELKSLGTDRNTEAYGLRNTDDHITIFILSQKKNALLMWLADVKGIALRNQMTAREMYKNYGYRKTGTFSRKICGLPAEGYGFTFDQQEGNSQAVETYIMKYKGAVCTFNCLGRAENREKDHRLFNTVLDSVKLQ